MDLLSWLQSEFGDAVSPRVAAEGDAVDGVQPQAIAAPRDEEAAQALVAWCGRENIAFVPRGGGTKLHIGAPPTRCDLIISTEKLTQIFDHDEGNATVQAGAGITIEHLNKEVEKFGQFAPLGCFPTGGFSTLGGTVVVNYWDGTKLKYGAPRDLVTGLHAVLSNGRLVKAGAKVVKNVAGYDLNKLFIGSFGTLGLITEVTVRLRPKPTTQDAFWVQGYSSWPEAEAQVWAIVNGPFECTQVFLSSDGHSYSVFAQFDGGESAVKAQIDRLPEGLPYFDSEDDQTEIKPPSENGFDDNVLPQIKAKWVVRAHLPLQWASETGKSFLNCGAIWTTWHCALGVVQAYFNDVPNIPNLRDEAEKLGGFLVVEKAPHEFKTPDLVWGKPRGDFALMQKLKQSFDAANVCAPGRFIGGL